MTYNVFGGTLNLTQSNPILEALMSHVVRVCAFVYVSLPVGLSVCDSVSLVRYFLMQFYVILCLCRFYKPNNTGHSRP